MIDIVKINRSDEANSLYFDCVDRFVNRDNNNLRINPITKICQMEWINVHPKA